MTRLVGAELTERCREDIAPGHIIVREGSEMAERLRSNGWAIRGGWRATSDSGERIWMLKFEIPAGVRDRG